MPVTVNYALYISKMKLKPSKGPGIFDDFIRDYKTSKVIRNKEIRAIDGGIIGYNDLVRIDLNTDSEEQHAGQRSLSEIIEELKTFKKAFLVFKQYNFDIELFIHFTADMSTTGNTINLNEMDIQELHELGVRLEIDIRS